MTCNFCNTDLDFNNTYVCGARTLLNSCKTCHNKRELYKQSNIIKAKVKPFIPFQWKKKEIIT